MEWVKPIDEIEVELRRCGIFMLVDVRGKRLRFYGHTRNRVTVQRLRDSLLKRSEEMGKFLIARAKYLQRGETT
jgi:hypothetical protein